MSSRPSTSSTIPSIFSTNHLDSAWMTSPSDSTLFRPNSAIWPSSSPASSSNNSHIMPGNTGSDDSSTPDFAFEPPSMTGSSSAGPAFDGPIKTPTYPSSNSTYTPASFAYPSSMDYSSASSFSSSSATGTSFSSVDNLPAISRDFARPSHTETRRPATAGGALQSSFGMVEKRENKPETIDEHSELFTDPFASVDKDDSFKSVPSQSQAHMDPHFVAPARRASEPHFAQPLNIQTHWTQPNMTPDHSANPSPHQPFALTSAPPNMSQFGLMAGANIHTNMQNVNRQQSIAYSSRPQTSDGLPSYGHINPNGVSLPSARTIANQLPSPSTFAPQSAPYFGQQQGMMPFRDNRAASMGDIHGQANGQFQGNRHYSMNGADRYQQPGQVDGKSELTFVPLGGPTPKKRPRRRYDEIERLYLCGWSGCEKAYGTLNHLNAHVAMQKHGDKRLPSEFKDMRKQWRKKKRDQAAAAANAQYMATTHTWNPRQSISSSESEFDRRDSSTSNFSIGSDYNSSHRGSVVYGGGAYQTWTGDSSRPTTGSSVTSSTDGRFVSIPPAHGAYAHGMINPSPAVRRPSAPGHMAIPPQAQMFRTDDQPTPTQQNPYPRPPGSANANHAGQFPFQSLTTPMPMMAGSAGQAGQFAFQR